MTEAFSQKHFEQLKIAYTTENENFAAIREALKETISQPGNLNKEDIAQDCAILGAMDTAAASVNAKQHNQIDALTFLKEARAYIHKSHDLGRQAKDVDLFLTKVELEVVPKKQR